MLSSSNIKPLNKYLPEDTDSIELLDCSFSVDKIGGLWDAPFNVKFIPKSRNSLDPICPHLNYFG